MERILKSLAILIAASFTLLTSTNAYALSCAQTGFDLESTFKANKASDQDVVYVLGTFSGKQTKAKIQMKQTGVNGIAIVKSPKSTTSTLSFSGKVMTRSGAKSFKQKVKVTASCIASWCGNIPKSGQKTIAALTKTNSGYTMTAGPCAPNTFSRQVNADWKKLKRLIK